MHRPNAICATIALTVACVCAPAGAQAGISRATTLGAQAGISRATTPSAQAAHAQAGKHRSKRARGACEISRGSRHKRHKRCVTRANAPRAKRSRAAELSLLGKARAHAKRADGPGATVTVSAAAASTIASVLATPCENTELMPQAGNLEQVRTATLCLVDQERARNNELPLRFNAQLEQAAQQHSEQMVGEDYFAHVAPNGETPLDRVQATGYIPNAQVGYTIGENIAWGTLYLATPNAIVAAWIASPEHLANILNSEYLDTAIGVDPTAPASLAGGQAGAVYTQVLGVIKG